MFQIMSFISNVICFELSGYSLMKSCNFEQLDGSNFHVNRVQICMEKDQNNNGYGVFTCERSTG